MKDITDMGEGASCFSFTACSYDPASGEAMLSYEVDGRVLQEKIIFPWAPWPVDASRQAAFYQALELLHLIAGISYYEAGLARCIDTGESAVDNVLADFLNELYRQGLGEFAYVNQLDLTGLINFAVNIDESTPANRGQARVPGSHSLDLSERALVAMGGGKDSLVCLRMLEGADIEVQPVCVGGSNLIGDTVKNCPIAPDIVTTLAEYPQISQSGELDLKPDFEADHCIPAAIMGKLNAF